MVNIACACVPYPIKIKHYDKDAGMENVYSQMIFNLAIILTFMLALFYIAKKLKFRKLSHNKHIKIINIVALGAKEKIILMEVNNTVLLIGSTPNHIETLYVFNELEHTKSISDDSQEKKTSFSDHLTATLN